MAACGGSGAPVLSDPPTTAALLRVARTFNADYGRNDDGPVWDRWDRASQAIITRAEFVARHDKCDTAPGAAVVEGATATSGGYVLVRYSIDATQLVDYWHYQAGAWRFDLLRSNPDAVRLYRLSRGAYAQAVGCR